MLFQQARLTQMKPQDKPQTRHCSKGETPAQQHLWKYETFTPIFHIFVQPCLQTGVKQRLKKGLKHPKQENKKKQGFNSPTTRNLFPKSQKKRKNNPEAIQKTPKNGRELLYKPPAPPLNSKEHCTEPVEERCCSFEKERSSTLHNRASLSTFFTARLIGGCNRV